VLLAPSHDRPELLGGLAALVWEVLDEPLTAQSITDHVREVIPDAADPHRAIEELVRVGLLDAQP